MEYARNLAESWPTLDEQREAFTAMRTAWLLPYRDRRAPIPQQHGAPHLPPAIIDAVYDDPPRRDYQARYRALRDTGRSRHWPVDANFVRAWLEIAHAASEETVRYQQGWVWCWRRPSVSELQAQVDRLVAELVVFAARRASREAAKTT